MNRTWRSFSGRSFGVWRAVTVLLGLAALYVTIVRFTKGLGAVTHLSDAFPWGLWIGFDVLVGVGLAAGGFAIAATVHIFHLDAYKPVARPAVFTAFVGYLLVIVGLLFDLGQPWDIWHPLVMWNPRSVMFEVAWCVTLYTTVLALEFSPIVFERLNLKAPLRVIRAFYLPLVVIGVLLSMMHQSSLGTLYVIVPEKLHGLWYTPWLPVFFFITALAAGLAMTIIESYLSYRAFGRELEHKLLEGLARVAVVLLGVYALWKFWDLAGRGNLHLAFQTTPEAVMFWGEMLLGVALPMTLMAIPKLREGRQTLFLAALLTVLGFIANRMNVGITGMARASGTSYFPAWQELVITAALVAFGFVAFAFAVKHLRLFPPSASSAANAEASASSAEPGAEAAGTAPGAELAPVRRSMIIGGWAIATLWLLLALGVGLYRWTTEKQSGSVQGRAAMAALKAAQSATAAGTKSAKPTDPGAPTAVLSTRASAAPSAMPAAAPKARPTSAPEAMPASAPSATPAAARSVTPAAAPSAGRQAALRLPAPFVFPRGPKSPGKVSFDHSSHASPEQPACRACHERGFRLLARGKLIEGALTMARIQRGELCGSCHNGKGAFGVVKGACTDACHAN